MLLYDDFEIFATSWTWDQAWANLWLSANEHAMPLGRISTWLLVQLAGGPGGLPQVAALQGPLAVLVGMGLIYLFVRRELGQPMYGLLAMAFFGVTSQYTQAVSWFAASFAILALDTVLLALLAAQRGRQTGNPAHLALSAFWCALAPCWFASGVLAGPLCMAYLLPATSENKETAEEAPSGLVPWLAGPSARLCGAVIPILGTALFLAISLPHTRERIMNLEQWGKKTADQAIQLDVGLAYSGRSVVDNLVLGSFGVSGVNCPPALVSSLLLFLAAGLVLWWYRAPNRRLVVLGVGFILSSYVLIYSARAEWPYPQISVWSRYQLFSHVGLVLIVCAGLPRWEGWFLQDWSAPEARRRTWLTCLVVTRVCEAYFMAQLPRVVAHDYYDPNQVADLRHVEEVDARCVEYRISATTARQALAALGQPRLSVAGCGQNDDGWRLLRGSPDPLSLTVEEARRILNDLAAPEKPSRPENTPSGR